MTREDVVNSYGYKVAKASVDYSQKYAKDDELQGIVMDTFEDAAKFGYNLSIDKACEWLYEYNRKQADKMFGTVHTADVTINVAEFRKAMESGSSEIPNNCEKGGEE